MLSKLDEKQQSRFYVRPQIAMGIIEIFDEQKNVWLLGTANWSHLPTLTSQFKIKTSLALTPKVELSFLIQDKITQKIYSTTKAQIYNNGFQKTYIQKLNHNINGKLW